MSAVSATRMLWHVYAWLPVAFMTDFLVTSTVLLAIGRRRKHRRRP